MTRLGDWVVEDPIGYGTATVVHRGHHRLHPDRVVAIKRLRQDTPSQGQDERVVPDPDTLRARLEREAAVLRDLAHPAIMPFTDVVLDGDGVALVMPLADGGSLAARIRSEGALPWQDVAELGARVAGGLAAAHGAGVVHRDVTPTNILYGRELEPRLADFGTALVTGDPDLVVGTPGYLDPMVVRGTPAGPASDVYGLGVVCYEALAGQPPFGGATQEATMRAADRGIHLPLAALAPDAPGNLTAIIEQAMQRDGAGRFPSAQALQVALEHVVLTAFADGSVDFSPPLPPPPWAATDLDPRSDVNVSSVTARGAQPTGAPATPTAPDAQRHDAQIPGARDAPADGDPAPTTDFGPRPIQPLEIDEPRRPAWMVAVLVAVVVVPLAVAAWALLAWGGGADESPAAIATDPAGTPAEPATNTPATAPPSIEDAPSSAATVTDRIPRQPEPLCSGQPTPAVEDLVGDVDGGGCAVVIDVSRRSTATILTVPDAAGGVAGTYALDGPPAAVVVGDWDGDGDDTPAVTLDPTGVVWAFPEWDAAESSPLGDPIGDADPIVVTDTDGIDHVVAEDGN